MSFLAVSGKPGSKARSLFVQGQVLILKIEAAVGAGTLVPLAVVVSADSTEHLLTFLPSLIRRGVCYR